MLTSYAGRDSRGHGSADSRGHGSADPRGQGSTHGELSALYSSCAKYVQNTVRLGVRAPDAVIEDACQFAWWKLLSEAAGVRREATLSWLVTTAVREVRRVVRRHAGECSLEELVEVLPESLAIVAPVDPHGVAEQRERLRGLDRIPRRQQRLLWLQGLGLSYAEMAVHECCTRRTVERQLLRAKERTRIE